MKTGALIINDEKFEIRYEVKPEGKSYNEFFYFYVKDDFKLYSIENGKDVDRGELKIFKYYLKNPQLYTIRLILNHIQFLQYQ